MGSKSINIVTGGGGVMSNYMKCGCADIQGPKLSGREKGRGRG